MEPEASELPKGLVLGKDENIHIRITPLGDVGCHNLVSEPNPGRVCADEDVGPLRGVDCDIPHRPGE